MWTDARNGTMSKNGSLPGNWTGNWTQIGNLTNATNASMVKASSSVFIESSADEVPIHDDGGGPGTAKVLAANCTNPAALYSCAFSVNSAGVLSRKVPGSATTSPATGGACQDPGCSYLSFSDQGITGVSTGTFRGQHALKILDLGANTGLATLADGAFDGAPNLKRLNLKGHRLSVLRSGTFGADLANLKLLDLSYRRSAYGEALRIESDAFFKLRGLEVLNLYGNQIADESMRPGLFRLCGRLNRIDLSYNSLTEITDSTFAGLRGSLWSIGLNNNNLKSVSPRAFEGFTDLWQVGLARNQLRMLPRDVFRKDAAPRWTAMEPVQYAEDFSAPTSNYYEGNGTVRTTYITRPVVNGNTTAVTEGVYDPDAGVLTKVWTNIMQFWGLKDYFLGVPLGQRVVRTSTGDSYYLGQTVDRMWGVVEVGGNPLVCTPDLPASKNPTLPPVRSYSEYFDNNYYNYYFNDFYSSIRREQNLSLSYGTVEGRVQDGADDILPFDLDALPLCPAENTLPPIGGVAPPKDSEALPDWLRGSSVRFHAAACSETRTWSAILAAGRSSPSERFRMGGLGSLAVKGGIATWVCWEGHPCLAAVGAASSDRMCYVFDQRNVRFHAWGLDSELGVCGKTR